jgi:hypothetical protein
MSSLRYVLRDFDCVRVEDIKNMNGVYGKVRASFNTKDELVRHCKTEGLELGLLFHSDTTSKLGNEHLGSEWLRLYSDRCSRMV